VNIIRIRWSFTIPRNCWYCARFIEVI